MGGPRTLHQEAVDRIAGWIVGGRFEAGTMLPREEEIGGELNVSRTVVREAMRTLTAKGMVEVRRRLGTRVRPVDTWSLFDPQVVSWRMTSGLTRSFIEDLVRFRLGIEPYAAGLAAANPEFPDDDLEQAYSRMEAAAVDGIGSEPRAVSMLITDRLNEARSVLVISGINWRRNRLSAPRMMVSWKSRSAAW